MLSVERQVEKKALLGVDVGCVWKSERERAVHAVLERAAGTWRVSAGDHVIVWLSRPRPIRHPTRLLPLLGLHPLRPIHTTHPTT